MRTVPEAKVDPYLVGKLVIVNTGAAHVEKAFENLPRVADFGDFLT